MYLILLTCNQKRGKKKYFLKKYPRKLYCIPAVVSPHGKIGFLFYFLFIPYFLPCTRRTVSLGQTAALKASEESPKRWISCCSHMFFVELSRWSSLLLVFAEDLHGCVRQCILYGSGFCGLGVIYLEPSSSFSQPCCWWRWWLSTNQALSLSFTYTSQLVSTKPREAMWARGDLELEFKVKTELSWNVNIDRNSEKKIWCR